MYLLSSSSFSSLSSLSSVGALTIVVVVVVVSLVVSILLNFLNKRSYSKPESYPLQNTIEVFVNQHRLLDSLQENLRTALKERGISTVDLNLWGLPRLVFTNSVQNVEHVLKTNFNNYGKGTNTITIIIIIIIIITITLPSSLPSSSSPSSS